MRELPTYLRVGTVLRSLEAVKTSGIVTTPTAGGAYGPTMVVGVYATFWNQGSADMPKNGMSAPAGPPSVEAPR